MLFALIVTLITAWLGAVAAPTETNAERFSRGLPPKPPTRKFDPSGTRAPLSKRSGLPSTDTFTVYSAGSPIGYVCNVNGYLTVCTTSSSAATFSNGASGAYGFTITNTPGSAILYVDADRTTYGYTGTTDAMFLSLGTRQDSGSADTAITSYGYGSSIWNLDGTQLFIKYPYNGVTYTPNFYYSSAYDSRIYLANSAAEVQSGTGADSYTFTQITIKTT